MSLRTYGEANKNPVFHVGDAWRRNIPWGFHLMKEYQIFRNVWIKAETVQKQLLFWEQVVFLHKRAGWQSVMVTFHETNPALDEAQVEDGETLWLTFSCASELRIKPQSKKYPATNELISARYLRYWRIYKSKSVCVIGGTSALLVYRLELLRWDPQSNVGRRFSASRSMFFRTRKGIQVVSTLAVCFPNTKSLALSLFFVTSVSFIILETRIRQT